MTPPQPENRLDLLKYETTDAIQLVLDQIALIDQTLKMCGEILFIAQQRQSGNLGLKWDNRDIYPLPFPYIVEYNTGEKNYWVEIKVKNRYSSQEDSACGYVDKLNRPRQAAFCCRCCGSQRHADVNDARNILRRRSDAIGDSRRPKQAILADLVRQFNELMTRPKRGATDPRLKNPYFREWTPKVT